jgi:hypothetical protein
MLLLGKSAHHWLDKHITHAYMRAFTTFNVKIYPIQHVEGVEEAVERAMNHNSPSGFSRLDFQEDGICPHQTMNQPF